MTAAWRQMDKRQATVGGRKLVGRAVRAASVDEAGNQSACFATSVTYVDEADVHPVDRDRPA